MGLTEENGFRGDNTDWEALKEAHHLQVDDKVFKEIAVATKVSKGSEIVLPAHKYEGLSRGRGWARKGRGVTAVWGERASGGYQVGPGDWEISSTDGFNRKGSNKWTVKNIQVGEMIWTLAD
jgi:hypothetical protein